MVESTALTKLINTTNVIYNMMDMCPYIMVLPMDSKNSSRTKRKILTKIVNNFKMCKLEAGLKASIIIPKRGGIIKKNSGGTGNAVPCPTVSFSLPTSRRSPIPSDTTTTSDIKMNESASDDHTDSIHDFRTIEQVIERLDDPDMLGCMVILGKTGTGKSGVVPVAGGIIEFFDDNECSIQGVWVDREVNNAILLESFILRLFAHAYQMSIDSKIKLSSMKTVSIYDNIAQYYPDDAYNFITKCILTSKHHELLNTNVKHIDHPTATCSCIKQAYNDSLTFHSITLARFANVYLNTLHDILLGHISTLANGNYKYKKQKTSF